MGEVAPAWFTAFTEGQFASLSRRVEETNTTLTSQVKAIDGRMAALEVRFDELQAKQAVTEKSLKEASSTLSSVASTSIGHKRFRTAGTVNSNGQGDETDPLRLWVSGYPRAVLDTTRRQTWTQLQSAVPAHLLVGTEAKFAKTSQSFSVHFTTQELANEFKKWFIGQDLKWVDARDSKPHALRIRADLPDDVRHRQRYMSKLWGPVVQHLHSINKFDPALKIGANGFRNEFFIRTETDHFVLVKGEVDSLGRLQLKPYDEDLRYWGITTEVMQQWIDGCRA